MMNLSLTALRQGMISQFLVAIFLCGIVFAALPIATHAVEGALPLCPELGRRLAVGSSGTDVANLQRFLRELGFFNHPQNTGFFGPVTDAAVRQFQRANGIVTAGTAATTGFGAVGPQTRRRIIAFCATSFAPVVSAPMIIVPPETLPSTTVPAPTPTPVSIPATITTGSRATTSMVRLTLELEILDSQGALAKTTLFHQVFSIPSGIVCNNDCTESFVKGTKITLYPASAAMLPFTRWSVRCIRIVAANGCEIVLEEDTIIKGTFTLAQQTLQGPMFTVMKVGLATSTGMITSAPAGINCGNDCTEAYPSGTFVTLTASVPSGTLFTGWSGCDTLTAPPVVGSPAKCNVSIKSSRTVNAGFVATSDTVSLIVKKEVLDLQGRAATTTLFNLVFSTPAGINCEPGCTAKFLKGTKIILYPSSSTLVPFTRWSVVCERIVVPSGCEITLNENTTVTATFTLR